ncbi:MAG: SpoIIE family protein phosphatase [Anaerolineae bacterium]
MKTPHPSLMQYGIFSRPKKGREVSGDAYVILEENKQVLLGVIDGLGSGEAAAGASQKAAHCIEENSTRPLPEIMTKCHLALHDTRGVVMALMRIDFETQEVSFVGVGNVSFHALSKEPIKPISKSGIVGYRLPHLKEFKYPYTPGDLFILHTDGVSHHFVLNRSKEESGWYSDFEVEGRDVQELAEEIASRFGKENDDITILVAR